MLDFHNHFPDAFILGVELDHYNTMLAGENLGQGGKGDWYRLIHAGVAAYNSKRNYDKNVPSNRYSLNGSGPYECLNLDYLLDILHGLPEKIDYIKMDIEGSEKEVLKVGGRWPLRTKCIQVELHDYPIEEAKNDLKALGFEIIFKQTEDAPYMIGFKRD